jgi:hypothetical protein
MKNEQTCREAEPILVLVAYGEADEAQVEFVTAHLKDCPACRRSFEAMEGLVVDLEATAPAPEPPPTLVAACIVRARKAAPPTGLLRRLRMLVEDSLDLVAEHWMPVAASLAAATGLVTFALLQPGEVPGPASPAMAPTLMAATGAPVTDRAFLVPAWYTAMDDDLTRIERDVDELMGRPTDEDPAYDGTFEGEGYDDEYDDDGYDDTDTSPSGGLEWLDEEVDDLAAEIRRL